MLFQPISQVRLTNVAVVKYRSHGIRFEVACYRNKVLSWRNGLEPCLNEVLQTSTVFQNVSKGQFAKREDLMKVFRTEDQVKICKIILSKGELQIAEEERKAASDAQFRDIVTFVADSVINPSTSLPLSRSMIENALRDIGFSVRNGEPTKRQGLRAIELLQNALPTQVVRTKMRLKMDAHIRGRQQILEFLKDNCDPIVETQTCPKALYDSENESQNKQDQIFSEGTLSFTETNSFSITFLTDPKHYRELDKFVQDELGTGGSTNLHLLASNVKICRKVKPPLDNSSRQMGCLRGNKNESGNHDHLVVDNLDVKGQNYLGLGERLYENKDTRAQQISKSDRRVISFGNGEVSPPSNSTQTIPNQADLPPTPSSDEQRRDAGNVKGTDRESSRIDTAETDKDKHKPEVEGIKCATCKSDDLSSKTYKAHCQSQWHLFNVKRKIKNLAPISQQEFEEVTLDIQMGFLAVD